MIINYLLLAFCYAVAIGFGARIYMFKKTGNPKYKHKYSCWIDNNGKHKR